MIDIFKKYIAYLPLLLLCIFYLFKSYGFPIHDYSNYYFGAYFLKSGAFNNDIYFPHLFNQQIHGLGYSNIFASYAPNTPFLAAFFSPFSWLPLGISKFVFNALSIGLFMFSLIRLLDYYKIKAHFILLLPILFFVPIKNELLFGQVYFLLFFLLSEGWLAYQKKQYHLLALYWSIALLLKVFPVLLIALLFFKKEWKALLYLLIYSTTLFLVTLPFTGIDVWQFYFQTVFAKSSNGEIASAFVSNYQSVHMFLKQLLVFDAVENPHALLNAPKLFWSLLMGFKISLLGLGFYITKKSKSSFFVFCYWILAILLLSPYGSTYSLLFLVFPCLYVFGLNTSFLFKTILLLLILVINNLPLSLFIHLAMPFAYLRLFLLLCLFLLFIYQEQSNIKWFAIAIASISGFIIVFFTKNTQQNLAQYYLKKEIPILTYDYKITNQQLHYYFWNEAGENMKSTTVPLFTGDTSTIEIKDKELFYKKQQITFDHSHKMKARFLDTNTIIYLSDLERGIGFYALRTIMIKDEKK
jgi:Glycosyltransferase family 87